MTKINHDLRRVDGATILHLQQVDGASGPGNLELPNIFQEDTSAIYPIGTKLSLGDRSFRYCYFGGNITYTAAGVLSYTGRLAQPNSYDAAQPAGTVELKVDGTSVAKNYYAGGYAKIGFAVNSPNAMKILKSTASALGDVTYPAVEMLTLTLEQGTYVETPANTQVDIFPNRFADVREAWLSVNDGPMKPFVGVPLRTFTSGRYGWIQTWGPVFLVCTNTGLGNVNFDRVAVFSADGSVEPCVEAWFDGQIASQIAGYALTIGGSGSEWIMLTLDP